MLVSVCESLVPTTAPLGIAFCDAAPSILPLASDNTKEEAAMPDRVLLSALMVLFVKVAVAVLSETIAVLDATAVVTNAVVAICVVLVPDEAVGANGVPVRVGLLLSALDDIAEAIAVNSVSISVPLTTLAGNLNL